MPPMTNDFLTEYFPRLGNDLITEVLRYVPPPFLKSVLMHHPDESISLAAFTVLFGAETFLTFFPGKKSTLPDSALLRGGLVPLNAVEGFDDSFKFLQTNKGRRISKLKLYVPCDLQLLSRIVDLVNSMDIAGTHVEYVLPSSSMSIPLDFENLLAIRSLEGIKFNGLQYMNESQLAMPFRTLTSSIDPRGVNNWLMLPWPKGLVKLELYELFVDYSTLKLPPSIKELRMRHITEVTIPRWELHAASHGEAQNVQLGPSSVQLIRPSLFPESLVVLSIGPLYLTLAQVKFPRSIKSLSLCVAIQSNWPVISWPPLLEYLRLDTVPTSRPVVLPNFLGRLPDSLTGLEVCGYGINFMEQGSGPRIEFPGHLESLVIDSVLLKKILLPLSLRKLVVGVSNTKALMEYDDETLEYGPKWNQLVNLKHLTIRGWYFFPRLAWDPRHLGESVNLFAGWCPPPNLYELNIYDVELFPTLPRGLDSLHTLKMRHYTSAGFMNMQLPCNLKKLKFSIFGIVFHLPILVCNHPRLETLVLSGLLNEHSLILPRRPRGSLVLKVLDLLAMPQHEGKAIGLEETLKFYDNIESAFGRVLTARPAKLHTRHFLVSGN